MKAKDTTPVFRHITISVSFPNSVSTYLIRNDVRKDSLWLTILGDTLYYSGTGKRHGDEGNVEWGAHHGTSAFGKWT